MIYGIGEELNIFFKAIMAGCVAGLVYDLIRVMRRIKKGKFIRVGIEDLVFFTIFSVVTAIFLYYINGGIFRAFIIAGIIIGIILFDMGPGYIIISIIEKIIRKIRRKH